MSTYNPSEKRRKRHRRSRPSMEPSDLSFKSIPSTATNDSVHIGKKENFSKRKQFQLNFLLENPSARVQFLLGDEDQDDDDEEHKPHDLFIELDELVTGGEKSPETGEALEQGWKETAR